MMHYYILVDGLPVYEPNTLKAMLWLSGEHNTRLAKDEVGEALVSTVFLGHDIFKRNGEPLFWETMVLGGEHDGYQQRHINAVMAARGHVEALRLVKGRL